MSICTGGCLGVMRLSIAFAHSECGSRDSWGPRGTDGGHGRTGGMQSGPVGGWPTLTLAQGTHRRVAALSQVEDTAMWAGCRTINPPGGADESP